MEQPISCTARHAASRDSAYPLRLVPDFGGRRRRNVPLTALAAICCAACLATTGCVERRMTIRTNVDNHGGALAVIDNQEIGTTPVSTGFTYYADREVKLIKDGYETVTLVQPVPAPFWDSLLVEFFVENLWPFTVRDEREFQYDMPPVANVSTGELLDRAQGLRNEGQVHADPVVPGRTASGPAKVRF